MIDATSYRSPNHSPRPSHSKPVAIVLHSSEGSKTGDLEWLCSPRSNVSAHYYIDRAGQCYELVDPALAAWHAGVSAYAGVSDWNQLSIGIELQHKAGQDWPPVQIVALTDLCRGLISQYRIAQELIVAHRWIATPAGRKKDPSDWHDASLRSWIASLYAADPCNQRYRVLFNDSRVRRLPSLDSAIETMLKAGGTVSGVEVLGNEHAGDRRWVYVVPIGYIHMSLLEPEP